MTGLVQGECTHSNMFRWHNLLLSNAYGYIARCIQLVKTLLSCSAASSTKAKICYRRERGSNGTLIHTERKAAESREGQELDIVRSHSGPSTRPTGMVYILCVVCVMACNDS